MPYNQQLTDKNWQYTDFHCFPGLTRAIFGTESNHFIMKERDHNLQRHREHHPRIGIGLFFIVLGLALLVATNDWLHLGDVKDYFTWQTAMIFVGVLLVLNLQFVPGLLLMAGGAWFLIDDFYGEVPALIKTIYWPAVIMLIGISFIITSLIRRNR